MKGFFCSIHNAKIILDAYYFLESPKSYTCITYVNLAEGKLLL